MFVMSGPTHILTVILILNSFICLSSTEIMYNAPKVSPISLSLEEDRIKAKPFIYGDKVIANGTVIEWDRSVQEIFSPILDSSNKKISIGRISMMNEESVLNVVSEAKHAWNNGQGEWPQMKAEERISSLLNVVASLKKKRDEIINVLMWEICKNYADAAAEFDRTMAFIQATIEAYRDMNKKDSAWTTLSGITAIIRRAAIGLMLCLGPFNYPFNETYATLIPALLLGNVAIMKIPMIGGLAHALTFQAFVDGLPRGVMGFVSGPGRATIGPIMRSGAIDILAFIGSSQSSDAILKQHPHLHRLKVFLQLEAKNLGIVLPDADLEIASEQITLGSTSFNGQRCTAIKLIFVHESISDEFLAKLINKISKLKAGLPWEEGVLITPLPEPEKPAFLEDLIRDAVSKGAQVVNEHLGGGQQSGSLVKPAIVYPVTANMRLWSEEQFGPVVPVAKYSNIEEVYSYLASSTSGQQAAIFTQDPSKAGPIVDILSTAVSRININTQCARSPDRFPFGARRSSGIGTMSVTEALKAFSVETMVATKQSSQNAELLKGIEENSNFLFPMKSIVDGEEL